MDSCLLRRLTDADAAAYRDLRLEGLRLEPQAFGSSYEEEGSRPASRTITSSVRSRRTGSSAWSAFSGPNRVKTGHVGAIWGMYVRPVARGRGIARRLLAAAIAEAGSSVRSLRLAVEAENLVAQRLYESAGFVAWAREAEALRVGDRFHDEILMRLEMR